MRPDTNQLLDLEEPILKAQHLAFAIHCFAMSDPMRGGCAGALSVLAETLMDEIGLVKEGWKDLLQARGQAKSEATRRPRGARRVMPASP